MEKLKFAMFMIYDDDMDMHEMHLMCNEGEKKVVWRQLIAAVFAQGVEEYPDLFDEVFEVEV